jgi:hypothetical protein
VKRGTIISIVWYIEECVGVGWGGKEEERGENTWSSTPAASSSLLFLRIPPGSRGTIFGLESFKKKMSPSSLLLIQPAVAELKVVDH